MSGMNNNNDKINNNNCARSKSDAAFKSKKVNPPPIRPDLKYINAEDEDQMVSILFVFM